MDVIWRFSRTKDNIPTVLNKGQYIAQMETAMEFDAWKLLSDTKQEDNEMLG